ncbi:hypothetical protein NHP190012_09380 [Helicobacter sp. NHP19-012]|uniref:Periplasmic competence protein n=1 Tax=Helicobacter gastrofelis TaxID=2849642 RepID=A0ABM7SES8_9HELI|nr:hypothetical protein [Helicobacter sp. NHP19-012]BCZ19296.1 hypothetical protein NHP190012_09380 [Helicobacter sp. NHP19-012]
MFWVLWLLAVACLQGLTIQTLQDLPLKQKSGRFSGYVLYKNTAQKQLIVEGVYRLQGNQLFLQTLRLKKLPSSKRATPAKHALRVLPLKLQTTQELGALLLNKIHKGTRIYFKDPSPSKMAQMLDLPPQTYPHFASPQSAPFLTPLSPTSVGVNPPNIGTQNPPQNSTKESQENKSVKTTFPTFPTYNPRSYSRKPMSTRKTTSSKSSSPRPSSARSTRGSTATSRNAGSSTGAKSTTSTRSSPSAHSAGIQSRNTRRYSPRRTSPNPQSPRSSAQNTPPLLSLPLSTQGAQEEACGVWSYDDEKLQATRPSVVRALDKASGHYIDISPCSLQADSAHGKEAGITLDYVELPPKIEVLGPTTTTHTFILSKANYSEGLCPRARTRQCLQIEPSRVTEWRSTYSTTTTRTIRTYQRPPQVGQTTPTEFSTTTDEVKAERKTDIKKNDLHLSPKFLEYVEVYEKEYLDSQVAHSKEYLEWQDKYVRPSQGTCKEYQVQELSKGQKTRPSIHNTRILCVKSGNYLLEEDKQKVN